MDDNNVDQRKAAFIAEVKKYRELGEIPAKALEGVLCNGETRLKGCGTQQIAFIRVIGERLGWVLPIRL
jgi:hypothetical protein